MALDNVHDIVYTAHMDTQKRRRWTYTLYHDEPEEAAVDTRTNGDPFATKRDAITAAKRHRDNYWQTATIEVGDWHPGLLGVRPPWWDETKTVAYIAPDGSVDDSD